MHKGTSSCLRGSLFLSTCFCKFRALSQITEGCRFQVDFVPLQIGKDIGSVVIQKCCLSTLMGSRLLVFNAVDSRGAVNGANGAWSEHSASSICGYVCIAM
jgi:hypothetical protein